MFESTTIRDPEFDGSIQGADCGGLRAFAWAELVARLSATRDLRTVLADVRDPVGGSFRAAATLRDRAHDREAGAERAANHETPVNPVGLVDGKAGEALFAQAAADAATVDREAQ